MEILNALRARLDTLVESRHAVVADIEALDASVKARMAAEPEDSETRSVMTVEESASLTACQERLNSTDAEIAPLRERVEELETLAAQMRQADGLRRPPVPGMADRHETVDVMSVHASPAELRARATSAVETSRLFASDAHRQAVTALLERAAVMEVEAGGSLRQDDVSTWAARLALVTCTPTYTRAWAKLMSSDRAVLTQDEAAAIDRGREIQRAMNVGTGNQGGFLVPTPLDPTMIITGAGSANPFRQISRIIQLATGNTWKGVSAGQISASWDAEASAVSDDSPTLAQPSIATFPARVFVPASFEAFEDIDGLAADVSDLFVDARDNLEAAAHAVGTGTGQPKGVMVAVAAVAGSRVATAGVGAFAIADVYNLSAALPPRYRLGQNPARSFVMPIQIINAIRQFATANNYHAFLTDLGGGQPAQLLGDALRESPSIVSAVATGNDIAVFGDFRRYAIVDRIGFATEFVPNLFDTATGRPTGQRAWLAHWRTGADALDTNAFRVTRVA